MEQNQKQSNYIKQIVKALIIEVEIGRLAAAITQKNLNNKINSTNLIGKILPLTGAE